MFLTFHVGFSRSFVENMLKILRGRCISFVYPRRKLFVEVPMTDAQDRDPRPAVERRTVSIDTAGRMLGLGRNGAYAAAAKGEIRTLQFGKRRVVPLAWLEQVLEGEATNG